MPAKALSKSGAAGHSDSHDLRVPEVVQIRVKELRPWAGNPREHTAEQLRLIQKSISAHGLVALPVVQKGTNRLLAGHGRLQALLDAGHGDTLIPVIVADLDDQGATAYTVADNRLTDLSGWSLTSLQEILSGLDDGAFDIETTGFTLGALEDLFGGLPGGGGSSPKTDPDAAPPVPESAETVLGEVLLMGPHRLICGDSTDPFVWRTLLAGDEPDLVLTDPPYGMDYSSNAKGTAGGKIKNDALDRANLEDMLTRAFACMRGAAKKQAAWYVWHSYHRQREFQNALEAAGLRVKSQIIWVKPSAGLGMDEFRRRHENAFLVDNPDGGAPVDVVQRGLVLEDHLQAAYATDFEAKPTWKGGRTQTTVWEEGRDGAKNLVHPTQKPVDLLMRALKLSSNPGDLVVDGFGGSGSTLVAFHMARRRAALVELDPKFCDVIALRWEALTGQPAVRVKPGQGDR